MSMKLAGRVFDYALKPTAAYILIALCDVAHDDGSHCFAGEGYLLHKTGVGRTTLYEHLATFERLGVLTSHRIADGRVERTINLDALPLKPTFKQPKRGGRRPAAAKNGAPTHGNVPTHARPARTPEHAEPEPRPAAQPPADADAWQPPDADAAPFDLPALTPGERATAHAAERYAGIPSAKRRRHPGARSGLGGWPA